MMGFDDWVRCRNISMVRVWYWLSTEALPYKVDPTRGWLKANYDTVLECEWEIQEYED